MDAPVGSVGANALEALEAGDVPGVSMVLVDGEIKVQKSRNTPPATRQASIVTRLLPIRPCWTGPVDPKETYDDC